MKSKKFTYELFPPGTPITPVETPVQTAKRKVIDVYSVIAYGVLIASILQGFALIAAGQHARTHPESQYSAHRRP